MTPTTIAQRLAAADMAEAWFAAGWRADPPESVTFGRIMLMAAKGNEKQRQIDRAIVELAQANHYRRTARAIEQLRHEQRESLAELHRRGLRIY